MIFKAFIKVSKGAKIRNRYNQVLHLTQDTNRKVTNSQLDTTNESQEASSLRLSLQLSIYAKLSAQKGISEKYSILYQSFKNIVVFMKRLNHTQSVVMGML